MPLPTPTPDWHMLLCAKCRLLLGWTRQKPEKPVYCIGCFDAVAHIPEET